MQDYKILLRNKNFTLIWSSQLLSQLAINIMNFILLVKLFEATGSSITTAMFWVAYAIPTLIVGPIAAVTADIYDRRKTLMYSNFLQASVIMLYTFIYDLSFFLPFLVVIAYSLLNQFYVPAEASSLPALVKKKQLAHANGLFFLTQQAALIVGFGVAGFLKTSLGFQNSLILCSSFLYLAFIAVSLLPKMRPKRKRSQKISAEIADYFRKILEGYYFIRNNSKILAPLTILLTLYALLIIIAVLTPAAAQEIFAIGANSAGVSLIVPVGIGAVTGAIFVPKMLKSRIRKKVLMENFMLVASILMLVFGLVIPLVSANLKLIFGAIIIALLGFSYVAILIPAQTFVQEATPNRLRGRVFGNFWFIATIVAMIPVIFSGVLSDLFGVRALITLIGVAALIMFVFSKKYGERAVQNKPIFGRRKS